MMIPPGNLALQSRRSAEFAHHDNKRIVQQTVLPQVGNHPPESGVKGTHNRRWLRADVGGEIDFAVVVPVAISDLDESRPQAEAKQVARHQAGVAELGVAITGLLVGAQRECAVHLRVVDEIAGALLESGHLGKHARQTGIIPRVSIELCEQSRTRGIPILTVRMQRGFDAAARDLGHQERCIG